METTLLTTDKDPMGAAIADYFNHHKANRLQVFSSQFDEDEIPVRQLFRNAKTMPLLERTALQWQTEVFSTLVPEVVAMPSLFRKWGKKYVLSTFLRCL